MAMLSDLALHRLTLKRVLAVVAVLAVAQVPDGTGAVFAQEPSATDEREQVRERRGEVELEVDTLESELGELTTAMETLAANVEVQEQDLEEAERAASDAEDDLEDAEEAVDDAEDRIEALEGATDDLMVAAYVNPPADTTFAAFTSGTMSDAAVKSVLLDLQTDTNADYFDELAEAEEDLELEQENKQTIAEEAATKRDEAEVTLEGLQTAYAQQETFAVDAETALELKVAESATLAERDEELSEQIAAEEAAALARQLEAARQAEIRRQEEAAAASGGGAAPAPSESPAPAPAPAPAEPAAPPQPPAVSQAPGGLATVACPRGGSITVASSMSSSLSGLLQAAAADGIGLCGWGWRDPGRQIALRQQNCGSSNYAVYQMPASSCSPPTARPGTSMHEQGLAVDFTCDGAGIGTRGSRCYQWLAGNAGRFGLYNLPSEPWHWSTTGR